MKTTAGFFPREKLSKTVSATLLKKDKSDNRYNSLGKILAFNMDKNFQFMISEMNVATKHALRQIEMKM